MLLMGIGHGVVCGYCRGLQGRAERCGKGGVGCAMYVWTSQSTRCEFAGILGLGRSALCACRFVCIT